MKTRIPFFVWRMEEEQERVTMRQNSMGCVKTAGSKSRDGHWTSQSEEQKYMLVTSRLA